MRWWAAIWEGELEDSDRGKNNHYNKNKNQVKEEKRRSGKKLIACNSNKTEIHRIESKVST